MKDIVQAEYNQLDVIAHRFQEASQNVQRMSERVQDQAECLFNGGWEGKGADSFFQEIERDILPANKRLIEALIQASRTTLEMKQVIQVAEEEAASLFRGGNNEETTAENSIIFPIPIDLFRRTENLAHQQQSRFSAS